MPLFSGSIAISRLRFAGNTAPERALIIERMEARPFEPIAKDSEIRRRAGFRSVLPSYDDSPADWVIASCRVQTRIFDKTEIEELARKLIQTDREAAEVATVDGEKTKRMNWTDALAAARQELIKVSGMKSTITEFVIRGFDVYVFGSVSQANEVRELFGDVGLIAAVYAPWIEYAKEGSEPQTPILGHNKDPHKSTHGLGFLAWLLQEGNPAVLEPEKGSIALSRMVSSARLDVSLSGPVCEDAYKMIDAGWLPTKAKILLQEKCITLDAATLTFSGLTVSKPKDAEHWLEKIDHRIKTATALVMQLDDWFVTGYLAAIEAGERGFLPDSMGMRVLAKQMPLLTEKDEDETDQGEAA